MHEFDVITRYFSWDTTSTNNLVLGVGDDAAVLEVPPDKQLVTSIDTLISGVHFPENTSAEAIGHKALAVNLSDLAAMGASPAWFTLALSMPDINNDWLKAFSFGLKSLARQYHVLLVGGDTTRGPLSISIQVMGLVDRGRALLRSGASVHDKIYVTGTLGDAAAGLQTIVNRLELTETDQQYCQKQLNQPQPRLRESQIIKEFASACIDISDGLLQDLSHIVAASGVGATLDTQKIPLSAALKTINHTQALQFALSGGDDYELLFTIPAEKEAAFLQAMQTDVCCIGVITSNTNLIHDQNNKILTAAGYNHFHAQ
jgi:thiamine-monophosphate kinase